MAQALPPSPPAIVITGQALPEARPERVYSADQISLEKIEQSPSRDIDQLLKGVPGVQLFRRSDAQSGHPTSQGVTLRALGGNASSRALLVLDGVPETDPFGGWINWPAYDPLTLSSIRVVRGGGSVAYGPGALAGTIVMGTRMATGVGGEIDAGSRDSLEASGRLGLSTGTGNLALFARGARGDGFVPITAPTRGPADKRAPYRQWSARGRWVMPIRSTTELQASAMGFHDWRNRGTDFSTDRTNGAEGSVRLVGRGDWQWSALGYWQWRSLRSSTAGLDPKRTIASRVLLQDEVPSHGLGGSLEVRPPMPEGIELRFGADGRKTTGETRELSNYVAANPTRRRRAGGATLTLGAFAEASAVLGGMTLTAGGRIDHWQVTNGHLFEQTIATGAVVRDETDPERDGWLPTARGGLLVPLSGDLRLRSAAYLGWRMPTLNELFRPFRAGTDATAANPGLDPERLSGIEAGFDYHRGPWRLSGTAFVNRLGKAISNVTLGLGPGTFPEVGFVASGGTFRQRRNVDAVKVRGIEASAAWIHGPWSIEAGASLSHARMEASGAAAFLDGLRPAQTPKFAASVSAGWHKDGKGVELVMRRVGAQFEDDLNTRLLKAATTLDASASWPLGKRFELVARAENVTNALVMAALNGDGSIERATPRTLWLGLRLK